MKKFAITSLALLTLAGCSAVTTKIKVDDTLKQQPELAVKPVVCFGASVVAAISIWQIYIRAITAEIRAIHGGCQLTMLTLN